MKHSLPRQFFFVIVRFKFSQGGVEQGGILLLFDRINKIRFWVELVITTQKKFCPKFSAQLVPQNRSWQRSEGIERDIVAPQR